MGYWEDRQEETLDAILEKAADSSKEISKLYAKSSIYLNEKIQGIFDRYRAKYDIGVQEAKELLNQLDDPTSFDEMLSVLGRSKGQERQELLKKLEAPAYRYRINRLQELQKAIDDMMVNIYSQEKDISTAHYIDSAQESYYRTIYNIQHDVGYEYNFATVDSNKVDKLLKNKWSGANYSQRIWNNTQDLAKELKENLLLGMLTGMSEREMRDKLVERFQVSNFKARRLIETESAYISSMMDMEAYKEADIDTMKFMAIHDFKTSKICQEHDGQYVKISEAKVGVNVPPLHPHCRSRMKPVIDEEFDRNLKRRVRTEDGTYEIVDANETYEQWHERTVKEKGKDTVEKLQKKVKYRYSDKEQYNRYKDVLGNENLPDSFDKFQEMKYNDSGKWQDIKTAYREVNWQTKALQNRFTGETHKVPFKGVADSVFDNYKDGVLIQRRYYGKKGKPRLDIDLTNHGNAKEHPVVPHYHDWFETEDGKVERDKAHDKELKLSHKIANKDILGEEDK